MDTYRARMCVFVLGGEGHGSAGLRLWILGNAQVIDDVANMGFSRHEVRGVIQDLTDRGQSVDLNVVLDRLMNGIR